MFVTYLLCLDGFLQLNWLFLNDLLFFFWKVTERKSLPNGCNSQSWTYKAQAKSLRQRDALSGFKHNMNNGIYFSKFKSRRHNWLTKLSQDCVVKYKFLTVGLINGQISFFFKLVRILIDVLTPKIFFRGVIFFCC